MNSLALAQDFDDWEPTPLERAILRVFGNLPRQFHDVQKSLDELERDALSRLVSAGFAKCFIDVAVTFAGERQQFAFVGSGPQLFDRAVDKAATEAGVARDGRWTAKAQAHVGTYVLEHQLSIKGVVALDAMEADDLDAGRFVWFVRNRAGSPELTEVSSEFLQGRRPRSASDGPASVAAARSEATANALATANVGDTTIHNHVHVVWPETVRQEPRPQSKVSESEGQESQKLDPSEVTDAEVSRRSEAPKKNSKRDAEREALKGLLLVHHFSPDETVKKPEPLKNAAIVQMLGGDFNPSRVSRLMGEMFEGGHKTYARLLKKNPHKLLWTLRDDPAPNPALVSFHETD